MEFALSPRFNFDMGMNMNPSLGFLGFLEEEEDDDEFYAEMRRQITILTGDYEDFPETKIVKPSYSSVTNPETKIVKPSYSSVTKPRSISSVSSQGSMSFWQNEYSSTTDSLAAPVQPAKSSKVSTGTGVFIPQTQSTVKPRRNNKPKSEGKVNQSGGKVNDRKNYKPVENKHYHEASY